VITAGIAFLKPEESKAWREAHERFTTSMKGAILVVAEKSGHMIPGCEPDLLVSVVSEVIRLAKRSSGGGPAYVAEAIQYRAMDRYY
jgi:hypothetical protein